MLVSPVHARHPPACLWHSWLLLILVASMEGHLFPVTMPQPTPLPCAEGPSRMSSFLQAYKGMNLAVCGLAPATVTMLCQDTKETPMSLVEVFLP